MWFRIKAFFVWLFTLIYHSRPVPELPPCEMGCLPQLPPVPEEDLEPEISEGETDSVPPTIVPPTIVIAEDSPEPTVDEPADEPEPSAEQVIEGFLTRNFHLDEFCCVDGTPVPTELLGNVIKLAKNLQVLRDAVGKPVHVCSGYRTSRHNNRVLGKHKSHHLFGLAADVSVQGMSPKHLAEMIRDLVASGKMVQGGVGFYPAFAHYDVSGDTLFWEGHRKLP